MSSILPRHTLDALHRKLMSDPRVSSPLEEDGDEHADPMSAMYEASVNGVHSQFQHLELDDIFSPPREWLDAALARQIALHLLVHRFGVPRKRIARELERSREAVNRALRTVDERLSSPAFEQSYEAMAEQAELAFRESK